MTLHAWVDPLEIAPDRSPSNLRAEVTRVRERLAQRRAELAAARLRLDELRNRVGALSRSGGARGAR